MDMITIANSIATITGLLSMYKQERKGRKEKSLDAFLQWLEDHKFENYKESLIKNTELLKSIEFILKKDNQIVLERLDKIDNILAALSSRVEGFGGIVQALKPDAELSDQAIRILRGFVKSGKDIFFKCRTQGGTSLSPSLTEINQPRFLEDDLTKLVELKMLIHEPKNNSEMYRITRMADDYIKVLDKH